MRLHACHHVPFENLAHVETWAKGKGHPISMTSMFNGGKLPDATEFDGLIILGGPIYL